MQKKDEPIDMIVDFITGNKIPDMGAERNRQAVEKFLVKYKKYSKDEIKIDAEINFKVLTINYTSRIDIIVHVDGKDFMAIKCAAGSLGSREREILSGARIFNPDYQIPFSVASDGHTAIVLDTTSGKIVGKEMGKIPSREEAVSFIKNNELTVLSHKKIDKERLIFRSYDTMNVNVKKNIL